MIYLKKRENARVKVADTLDENGLPIGKYMTELCSAYCDGKDPVELEHFEAYKATEDPKYKSEDGSVGVFIMGILDTDVAEAYLSFTGTYYNFGIIRSSSDKEMFVALNNGERWAIEAKAASVKARIAVEREASEKKSMAFFASMGVSKTNVVNDSLAQEVLEEVEDEEVEVEL